jgi:hypothetical protein
VILRQVAALQVGAWGCCLPACLRACVWVSVRALAVRAQASLAAKDARSKMTEKRLGAQLAEIKKRNAELEQVPFPSSMHPAGYSLTTRHTAALHASGGRIAAPRPRVVCAEHALPSRGCSWWVGGMQDLHFHEQQRLARWSEQVCAIDCVTMSRGL